MNAKSLIRPIRIVTQSVFILVLLAASLNVQPALAAAPGNDDFNNATPLTAFPLTESYSVSEATHDPDDPLFTNCNADAGTASVWYQYTPSVFGEIHIDTFGSNYDTLLGIWKGTRTSLVNVACNDDALNQLSFQSELRATLEPGTTYYIEVALYVGGGAYKPGPSARRLAAPALQTGTDLVINFEFVAAIGAGKYDDSYGAWVYTPTPVTTPTAGNWVYYPSIANTYQNTLHLGSVVGTKAAITFNGKQFILTYVKATNRGYIDVKVDGVKIATINAYYSGVAWQATWTSPVLDPGIHTVEFIHAGGQTYIDIDAIQIIAPLDTVPPSAITNLVAATGSLGGVDLTWNAPGDDNNIGTASSYLVRFSPSAILTTTDWNNATPVTVGVPTPALAGTQQTMTVVGLPEGNTYYFAIRAKDEEGNLGGISNSPPATAAAQPPLGAGKFDDAFVSWKYTGTGWSYYPSLNGPYLNTLHLSTGLGDYAEVQINGNQITLFFTKSSNRGYFEVYIDGSKIATVNAYDAGLQWAAQWTSPKFAFGVHTVKIVHLSGAYTDVDAIQVYQPADQVPPAQITNLAAVTGLNGGVDLSWSAVGDDGMDGTAAKYNIRYSLSPITNLTEWNAATPVASGIPTPAAPTTGQGMVVPGLTQGVDYYFAIRAEDEEGNQGSISNSPHAVAAPPPANGPGTYDDNNPGWTYTGTWTYYPSINGPYLSTLHLASTAGGNKASFVFNGNQFALKYTKAENRGYIDVKVDGTVIATINAYGSLAWNSLWTSPKLTAGVHTVEFIQKTTAYVDIDGIIIFAPADTSAPPQITTLAAATGLNGGVDLSWTSVGDDTNNTGTATKYQVRFASAAITDQAKWDAATVISANLPTPQAPGNLEQMVVLTGLTPGQTYYFAVRAEDEEGNLGPISNSPPAVAATPPALGAGTYDDNHPSWAYANGWTYYPSIAGPYNNTVHLATNTAPGSLASVYFNGSKVVLYFPVAFNRGTFDVKIDGAYVATVNQYNGATIWQGYSWTSPSYTPGVHLLEIVQKTTAYIDVDKLVVVAPADVSPPPVMDSLQATSATFEGVDLAWTAVGDDSNNSGKATAYLIRYAASPITTQAAWDAANVVASGIPTPANPGTGQSMTVTGLGGGGTFCFAIRAKDEENNLSPISAVSPCAAATVPPALGPGTYDDNHGAWTYTGSWTYYPSFSGPYQSTLHLSGTVGNKASITFEGTRFALKYTKAINRGYIEVKVDGVSIATINANSASTTWNAEWTSPLLTNGTHTVEFIHKAGGAGGYIDIDGFIVIPPADAINPAQVNPVIASPGTGGGVDLSWSEVGDDGMTGVVTKYLVRWSTSAITTQTQWDTATVVGSVPAPVGPGNTIEMSVGGLTPGTTYHFAVRAQDDGGNLSSISPDASAVANTPPAVGPGTYDDFDSHWVYSGAWTPYPSFSGPYLNTLHLGTADTAKATIYFNGVKVQLVFPQASNRGSFYVKIDDAIVATVTQTGATTIWNASWTSNPLSPGVHKLEIVFKTGQYIDVDKLIVFAPADSDPPSQITTLNATSAAGGGIDLTWTAVGEDGTTNTGTATKYLVRYGTSAITDETKWNAAVPVTAGVPTPGAPGTSESMNVLGGLIGGQTYYFAVRAQDEEGQLGPISNSAFAVAVTPPAPGAGTYDDYHGGWTYTGSWAGYPSFSGPYSSTVHISNTAGARAAFTFEGVGFTLGYPVANNRGKFDVWIDGSYVATVNQYSASTTWQGTTWSSPVLTNGTHTLEIIYNASNAAGAYIDVDKLVVTGAVVCSPTYNSAFETALIDLINAERIANSLPALTAVGSLTTAARDHSVDMACNYFFDHVNLNGDTPQDRATAAGYTGLVGENIAAGYSTAQAVFDAWKASSGHYANILGVDYTEIGIGYAVVSGSTYGTYWTADFGIAP